MTIRLILRVCLAAVVVVGAAAAARAQEDVIPLRGTGVPGSSATGSISGRVVLPNGQPVEGRVRITLSTIAEPGMVFYTDNSGGFGFTGLREATYTLEVEGDSRLYQAVTQEIRLIRGTHARLLINLKEKPESASRSPKVVSAAELDPKVPSAARKEYLRGVELSVADKVEEAIQSFKRAIDIYPTYLLAHNDLGVQYLKLKRFAEATEQFETAVQINPKAFNPNLNLGIVLVKQRKFLDAIDRLNHALSIDSSSAAGRLYLGVARVETDDLDAAERELSAAIVLGGPELTIAHFFLAQVYLKKGEGEAAVRELNAYLKASPDGEHAARARRLLEELKN